MIELEHVTKRYGTVTALTDVSLRVPKGRTVGLLGRNGAGKSTALNLITGYFPPTEGRVRIGGMDMLSNARECKRMIGYLPERPPLYDEMTVREYLTFVCELKEVAPKAIRAHTDEIMELCGLTDVRGRILGHLSKGYRQRAGFAQALCGDPDILVLDEPTVGLDPVQVVEIRQLIRELGKERTVLFSSHILPEVQQICSDVIIISRGRVICTESLNTDHADIIRLHAAIAGSEKELLPALRSLPCVRQLKTLAGTEPGVTEVMLVCDRMNERGPAQDQLFRLLSAMDAPLRMLKTEQDSLEEIFLRAESE